MEKGSFIDGMAAAKEIIQEQAVKLRETGLNHDAAILTDAVKPIEARINELQHAVGVS